MRWSLFLFLLVALPALYIATLLVLERGRGPLTECIWLGTLGGDESEAFGVSMGGSVVVGRSKNADGRWRAFRWTQAGGMQDLGTLGGDESMAYGVSADGSVVVGAAKNADGHWRAFRWTQAGWTQAGGMQDLGTLGGNGSMAYGVSADGSVVVGMATKKVEGFIGGRYERRYVRFEVARIFRWTQASGMKELSGYLYTAISPDGRYIAGYGYKSLWFEPRKAFLLVTRE
jgi:probable HAF family extracellular repeat protein